MSAPMLGLNFPMAVGTGTDDDWVPMSRKAVMLTAPPPPLRAKRKSPKGHDRSKLLPLKHAPVSTHKLAEGKEDLDRQELPSAPSRHTSPSSTARDSLLSSPKANAGSPPPSRGKPQSRSTSINRTRPSTASKDDGDEVQWLGNGGGHFGCGVPVSCSPDLAQDRHDEGFDEVSHIRAELIRLRKRLHQSACDLQRTREQLELSQRELQSARSENDELRLKYNNLERSERLASADLLAERHKCDELSKQVKAMSQNLLSIMDQESNGADKDISGLQKRCFKLVQQNTELTMQSSLLRRQKGWAEAKARVLQDEVTRVYLGTHDQVKSPNELEQNTSREFTQRKLAASKGVVQQDGAQICKLLLPVAYKHKEAVIDFLTHITHTSGNDVFGFLQSSRVFSEAIRNECLSGLGREYYAHWRLVRQMPCVLRAAERIVHLGDYLEAFEGFSKEMAELLGCAHTKLWVVDNYRHVLWTCFRSGEEPKTFELQLPRGHEPNDLSGQGLPVAACIGRHVVSVQDARSDARHHRTVDAVGGRLARSCLCVPVLIKSQCKVVLQAMNKLTEPDFDTENDARMLRLLGRVSMEALQVCQKNTTQSAFAKRKDSLLQLFNDFVPCQTPVQLLHALETGLRELFNVTTAALHVVKGRTRPVEHRGTMLLQVDSAHKRLKASGVGRRRSTIVQRVETDGLRGIVGAAAKSLQNFSFSNLQKEGSPHDSEVDLDMPERTVLHTVPLIDSGGCSAVCQFLCPDLERTIVVDDGTFHPDNMQHMRLLSILLKFVSKHLDVIDRKPWQEGFVLEAANGGDAPHGNGGAYGAVDQQDGSSSLASSSSSSSTSSSSEDSDDDRREEKPESSAA